jgi:hypothetical protein
MVAPDGPAMQSRVGYVKDWDELAQRTADHFAAQCPCDKRAVFVTPGPDHMPFAIAYKQLLEDKLRRKGILIAENALHASVLLHFEVQTFLYPKQGREVPLILVPVGAVFDVLASVYDTSKAEVMLTVSVSDGDYLRYSDPSVFYVRPTDLGLYGTRLNLIHDGDRIVTHWVNDNPASGIRTEWHESDTADGDHPSLAPFIIPPDEGSSGGD